MGPWSVSVRHNVGYIDTRLESCICLEWLKWLLARNSFKPNRSRELKADNDLWICCGEMVNHLAT